MGSGIFSAPGRAVKAKAIAGPSAAILLAVSLRMTAFSAVQAKMPMLVIGASSETHVPGALR
jgi:hypothetical protein